MATDTFRAFQSTPEAGATSTKPSQLRYVCFGPIQVDLQKGTVMKEGSRINLSGKAFDILAALLVRPGEIVTRESLCQRLWPSEVDIDKHSNLNAMVNKLRRSLGDSSRRPLYIETIPRKGYVLVAQPEIAGRPDQLSVSNIAHTNASEFKPSFSRTIRGAVDSSFPLIAYIAGLLLIGSLFGAAICIAAWITFRH